MQFNAESKIFCFVLNPIILTPHLYSRDLKPKFLLIFPDDWQFLLWRLGSVWLWRTFFTRCHVFPPNNLDRRPYLVSIGIVFLSASAGLTHWNASIIKTLEEHYAREWWRGSETGRRETWCTPMSVADSSGSQNTSPGWCYHHCCNWFRKILNILDASSLYKAWCCCPCDSAEASGEAICWYSCQEHHKCWSISNISGILVINEFRWRLCAVSWLRRVWRNSS